MPCRSMDPVATGRVRCRPMTTRAPSSTGIAASVLLGGQVCIVSGVGPGLGRQAAEASGSILYLASDLSSAMTGQTVDTNGGQIFT